MRPAPRTATSKSRRSRNDAVLAPDPRAAPDARGPGDLGGRADRRDPGAGRRRGREDQGLPAGHARPGPPAGAGGRRAPARQAGPAAADRHPDGHQRRAVHRWCGRHRGLPHPGGLRASLQRYRGGAAGGRRGGVSGQDQLRRVRHGIVQRKFRLLAEGVKGLRLGVPKEYFVDGMEPEVEAAIRAAIRLYERQGAHIEEVSLPNSRYALPAYYIIAPAEASSDLARYDGIRYGRQAGRGRNLIEEYQATRQDGFGNEVKRRIMLGTYALSSGYYDAYYLKAQKVRTLVVEDFARAFEKVDALLGATSPTVAFPLGAKTADPLAMYLNDIITIPGNLGNVCGISVPCGLAGGLPVGLQVIAPGFREEVALRVAFAYESASGFHNAHSPLLEAAVA